MVTAWGTPRKIKFRKTLSPAQWNPSASLENGFIRANIRHKFVLVNPSHMLTCVARPQGFGYSRMPEIIRPSLPKTLSLAEIKQALKLTNDNISRINERLRGWDYTLQHGTELLVESPVSYQVTKAIAVRAVDSTTNLDVTLPTSLLVRQVTPGVLGITVQYAPPLGRVSLYKNSDQTLTDSVVTALTWDGDLLNTSGITTGNLGHNTGSNPSRITCAVNGFVEVGYTVAFNANLTNTRAAWTARNGDSGAINRRRGSQIVPGADPVRYFSSSASTSVVWEVTAGDYLEIIGYQTSTGNLAVRGGTSENTTCWAQYVAPDPATTARVTLMLLDT